VKGVLPLERLDARMDAKLRRDGYLTFDGWRAKNRGVKKGEKARKFNSHGKAVFHESQTVEIKAPDWLVREFAGEMDEFLDPDL
jgi:hypothetical protein